MRLGKRIINPRLNKMSSLALPLFDLADVDTLVLHDEFAPGHAEYIRTELSMTLRWAGDWWTGEVVGKIGPDEVIQQTWSISIADALVQANLTYLGTAELAEEPYHPYLPFVGPSHYHRMEVITSQGTTLFETHSWGKDYVPWRVTLSEKVYSCHTIALGEAWRSFSEALEREAYLDTLFEAWDDYKHPKPPKRKRTRASS